MILLSQPMILLGQLMILLGQPVATLGQLRTLLGQPMKLFGHPVILLGQSGYSPTSAARSAQQSADSPGYQSILPAESASRICQPNLPAIRICQPTNLLGQQVILPATDQGGAGTGGGGEAKSRLSTTKASLRAAHASYPLTPEPHGSQDPPFARVATVIL